MAKTIHLLKQVRNAAASINKTAESAEYKMLLTASDIVLNEMMLEASPDFYLAYLQQGKKLLIEGRKLAAEMGTDVPEPFTLQGDLNAGINIEIINAEIKKLHDCMVAVVAALDEARSLKEKNFLIRMSDWESSIYNHSLEQVSSLPEKPIKPLNQESFQDYLAMKFPAWKEIAVNKFMVLDGGFSKKTIMVETEDAVNGRQEMVIRAEQPVNLLCFEGSDVTQEFHMIQLMRDAGLPIAEPLWLEADRNHLGTRFIVSRKAIGKTIGGNFSNNEALSKEQVESMMSIFIKMHNIKTDPNNPLAQKSHLKEWLPYKTVSSATRHYVTEFLPRLIRLTGQPASPQLLRVLKWLQQNIPDDSNPPVIVHIDYSFNNLIFDNSGVTAVLDWESSRLGDPAEDITQTQPSMSNYLSLPEFLKLYKAGTGRDVSEYSMAYCRLSKAAINVITCLSAMHALTHDSAAHINMATMAYKYQAMFAPQFNAMIAEAEALRER